MADVKVSALTEDTAPTGDDLVPTVHDPAGVPASRKVTIANLTKGLAAATDLAAGVVELATNAETIAGTDTTRAVTPANGLAAFQPLAAVLTATTAGFTIAQQNALAGMEPGATADQTAAEILAALITVDGVGSALDADFLDGNSSAAFATAAQGTTADAAIPKALVDAKGDLIVATTADTVARLAVGATDGHVLKVLASAGTGLEWGAVTGGSGGPAVAKNSGLQSNTSNTTLVNVTGISFAVTSGKRYMFKAMLPFQTAATTTGIGFGFTGPTMTTFFSKVNIQQGAAGIAQDYNNTATALATVLTSTAVVAATTTYLAEVEVLFTPSATGTLQLQFRSEVNASNVSILDGAAAFLIDCG